MSMAGSQQCLWNHGLLQTLILIQTFMSLGKYTSCITLWFTDIALVIIGSLQEMESGKDAYVRYDPAKENAWVKAIFKALGDKSDNYYKVGQSFGSEWHILTVHAWQVASQQLVTILIVVIAKKKHQHFITDVDTAYVGVGLMNVMASTDVWICMIQLFTRQHRATKEEWEYDFASMIVISVSLGAILLPLLTRSIGVIKTLSRFANDSHSPSNRIHLSIMWNIPGMMQMMKECRFWKIKVLHVIGQWKDLFFIQSKCIYVFIVSKTLTLCH